MWTKSIAVPFHLYQDGGHLGVLLFFLISGFIISHVSFSETRSAFITKRFYRLAPSFLLAIVFMTMSAQISKLFSINAPLGTNLTNLMDYFYSITLLNWPLHRPPVLSVTWSLFIEVIFYFLTWLFLNRSRVNPERATWQMVLCTCLIIVSYPIHPIVKGFSEFAMYVLFLLVGRSIYLGWSKRVSFIKLLTLNRQ